MTDPQLAPLIDEQRAHTDGLMALTSTLADLDTTSPQGLAFLRAAMEPGGLFGATAAPGAQVRTIAGPAGPIPLRILLPAEPIRGVYLHLHGGAMTVGSAASSDARNAHIVRACAVASVSVDYRLAPEHPYPAGPDDAQAAAQWLLENAGAQFGSDRIVIGGESAGAYLSVVTLLRLRDAGLQGILGANLCYGIYDFGGTPSQRLLAGKVPYSVGSSEPAQYLPGRTGEALRDPAVSPMWADLTGLPPALFTVGTRDWLLDDSLFLAARWTSAGNTAVCHAYPEAPHGVDAAPTAMGRLAAARIDAFLRSRLDSVQR